MKTTFNIGDRVTFDGGGGIIEGIFPHEALETMYSIMCGVEEHVKMEYQIVSAEIDLSELLSI